MFLKPQKLGNDGLSEEELPGRPEKLQKIGPCGLVKGTVSEQLYIDRQYYIPVRSVSRVFKRVAVYEQRRIQRERYVATIPYLVVVYEDGKEKQCNFKYEDQGGHISFMDPAGFSQIKTVSHAAEVRMAEEETKEAEKNNTTKLKKQGKQ